MKEFTTAEHHHWFAEFIRCETAVGGPDPHLRTLGPMLRDADELERVWRCGLYGLGYNVPTAEVVWQHWPYERMDSEGSQMKSWMEEHWPEGFGLRRERRAVRTPEKFFRCAESYYAWMTKNWPFQGSYSEVWDSTSSEVYGMGRYVLLKVLEALRRYCGTAPQDDIRAKGGRSPREGLAILFPQYRTRLLEESENPRNVRFVEALANWLKWEVEDTLGLTVDHFTLQVVLCEYKKTFLGRQYPGRTHDTELRYWKAMQKYWENQSEMLAARSEVFESCVLGEKNGWWEAREELCATLPEHGYMWNDLEFDYHATTDLANPVPRKNDEPVAPAKKQRQRFNPAAITTQLHQSAMPPEDFVLVAFDYDLIINVGHKGADPVLSEYLGERYIYEPLFDSGKLLGQLDKVKALVDQATQVLQEDGRVLVHCWYGKNRSGFVNTLILREHYGYTTDQALALLRERRGKGVLSGREKLVEYLRSLDEVPV